MPPDADALALKPPDDGGVDVPTDDVPNGAELVPNTNGPAGGGVKGPAVAASLVAAGVNAAAVAFAGDVTGVDASVNGLDSSSATNGSAVAAEAAAVGAEAVDADAAASGVGAPNELVPKPAKAGVANAADDVADVLVSAATGASVKGEVNAAEAEAAGENAKAACCGFSGVLACFA